MRDNTPPKSYSNKFDNNGGHHSAPSSPVFLKRDQIESSHNRHEIYHTSQQQPLNTHWHDNNHRINNYNNNSIGSTKSPALSPASSSDSTSDMNLLQELQQHAFFKSPKVDRSVSKRSF